jgi:biopolymer transport protein ExbD
MAGQSSHEDGGLFAGINVTPLVDVTLVLLIIFMVAAPLMVSNPSIKVQLPKASTGDETDQSPLALALEKREGGHRLTLNGRETDEASIRDLIPKLVEKNQDLEAIIAADQGLPYGEIVHLVDLVKALGVRKFALDTDPSP